MTTPTKLRKLKEHEQNEKVFGCRDSGVILKMRLIRCYIFTPLLYKIETHNNKPRGAEKKGKRKRTHRHSEEKKTWHVTRGEKFTLLQLIMQGNIQRKRSVSGFAILENASNVNQVICLEHRCQKLKLL